MKWGSLIMKLITVSERGVVVNVVWMEGQQGCTEMVQIQGEDEHKTLINEISVWRWRDEGGKEEEWSEGGAEYWGMNIQEG